MRSFIAASMLFYLSSAPGCVREECEFNSPRLELRLTFSDFDLGSARRLELESTVTVGAPADENFYSERRGGSLPFPAAAEGGSFSLLMDPGRYVAGLIAGESADERSFQYELWVRVFGRKGDQDDVLLAEGRLSQLLSVDGCYLDRGITVAPAESCSFKGDGDACTLDGDQPAVCKCVDEAAGCTAATSGNGLRCEASTCPDGYVDWRRGELCDPDLTPTSCTSDCLPLPVVGEISTVADASGLPGLLEAPNVNVNRDGDAELRGFYTMAYDEDATALELGGSLLLADIDGDGLDELMIGLPEGFAGGTSERSGMVWVMERTPGEPTLPDNSGQGFKAYFDADHSFDNPKWLGASLAAADLNHDGVRDLIMGAPQRLDAAGAFHVAFGGAAGTLTRGAENLPTDVEDAKLSMVLLQGEQAGVGPQLPGGQLGYAMVAGDFDGDGVSDLAVAAPGFSGEAGPASGAVLLMRGGTDAWVPHPEALEYFAEGAPLLLGARAGGRLGVALASGDVDGDGRTDLVLGGQAASSGEASGVSTPGYGEVHLLFGSEALWGAPSEVDVSAPPVDLNLHELLAAAGVTDELFGVGGALAVGDLDGDALAEVAVSVGRRGSAAAPEAVLVIKGSALTALRTGGTLNPATDILRLQGAPGEGFGAALLMADVNGDRRADLVVGAPLASATPLAGGTADNAGAVYVLLGSARADYWRAASVDLPATFAAPAADLALPLLRLSGGLPGGFFGSSLAASSNYAAKDRQANLPHLFVFEPGNGAAADNGGRIWMIYLANFLPCRGHAACPMPQY